MKYLLITLSLILSACGTTDLDRNFYSYHHGYQVISGEPDHMKPLGWGGGGHTEFERFDPFKFADEHRDSISKVPH
jgi:hypothetical protein